MCPAFCLHRVGTQPFKVGTGNLGTLVAVRGQGAGKHGISEDSVVQTTITEHAIVVAGSEMGSLHCGGHVNFDMVV